MDEASARPARPPAARSSHGHDVADLAVVHLVWEEGLIHGSVRRVSARPCASRPRHRDSGACRSSLVVAPLPVPPAVAAPAPTPTPPPPHSRLRLRLRLRRRPRLLRRLRLRRRRPCPRAGGARLRGPRAHRTPARPCQPCFALRAPSSPPARPRSRRAPSWRRRRSSSGPDTSPLRARHPLLLSGSTSPPLPLEARPRGVHCGACVARLPPRPAAASGADGRRHAPRVPEDGVGQDGRELRAVVVEHAPIGYRVRAALSQLDHKLRERLVAHAQVVLQLRADLGHERERYSSRSSATSAIFARGGGGNREPAPPRSPPLSRPLTARPLALAVGPPLLPRGEGERQPGREACGRHVARRGSRLASRWRRGSDGGQGGRGGGRRRRTPGRDPGSPSRATRTLSPPLLLLLPPPPPLRRSR